MKARVLLAIGVAVLVAIAIYLLGRGGGSEDKPATPATPANRQATTAQPGEASAPPPDAARSAIAPRPAHTAAERTAMLEAIATARAHRTATAHATPTTSAGGGDDTPAATTLDIQDRTGDTSAWEKRALGTLDALLGECYDLGRAEDPKLEGKVKLRFTLVGEPKVGAVLEKAEIVDDDGYTTITQQTIRDCMTQQLYALELDPPPEGMRVEREVTLQFP